MRNFIFGGIGVVWGVLILGARLINFLTTPAQPNADRYWSAGGTVATIFGVLMLVAGGIAIAREVMYMRQRMEWDSFGKPSSRPPKRRKKPASRRERDEDKLELGDSYDDARPRRRAAAPDKNALLLPIIIIGVVVVLMLVVGLGGLTWIVISSSRRAKTTAPAPSQSQELPKTGRRQSGESPPQGPAANAERPRPTFPAPMADDGTPAALASRLQGEHDMAADAMKKLRALGSKAEAEVRKYLWHDDFNARCRAAEVLQDIGTSESLDDLTAAKPLDFGGRMDQAIARIKERGGKSVADTSPKPPPVSDIFAAGPRVFLADLQEFEVVNGAWPFTKNGRTGDSEGSAIKVKGKASPKGLGMHPPAPGSAASVKYRLGKKAAIFKATVALNDTGARSFGSAIFSVVGDGKVLFTSSRIGGRLGATDADCVVDVTGVDVLELRVSCERSNTYCHAVWVEPRLLQRADAPDR